MRIRILVASLLGLIAVGAGVSGLAIFGVVIARALRDAGMEMIHTGIGQTPER